MTGDRDLSQVDYLDVLQKEYFLNLLKSKIYIKLNDRLYYKKVMSFKMEKILNISEKNFLPNIFSDELLFKKYRATVFPKQGLPEVRLSKKEIDQYYSTGSDVRVDTDEGVFVGKILSFDGSYVRVKFRGEDAVRPFSFKVVTRVFY